MPDMLDTSALVHYARRDPVYRQIEDERHILSTDDVALISIVSVGEINSLLARRKWGSAKREQLNFVLTLLQRVNLDAPLVIESYSLLDVYSLDHGRQMGKNDLWIAACAYAANATLITLDNDFDHLSELFNIIKYKP